MYAGSLLGMSELAAVLCNVVQEGRRSGAGLVRQLGAQMAQSVPPQGHVRMPMPVAHGGPWFSNAMVS
jgi:hypothetical protein